jgi:hypothetical protein
MAKVKPGDRLRSGVCATEVIVVRAPDNDVTVCCGGVPMTGDAQSATPPAESAPAPGAESAATLLGKRYTDEARRLELLCVKAGCGPLTVNGDVLGIQTAKPLPASD